MLFSSITFLFFFLPLATSVYFIAPTLAWRNLVLLAMSLAFYAWGEPAFVLILCAAILLNYVAALLIDRHTGRTRLLLIALALAIDLLILGTFKYANFFASALQSLGFPVSQPGLMLPLGISFFTFHCMSYLIDVYRKRFPANRSLQEVALYIVLFPQLVAGPIVRYKTIARQLSRRHHSFGRASAGVQIFIIGLAQKILIADVVAPVADSIFAPASHPSCAEAWLGVLAYTLQIYFDFLGYSNMAVGLGFVFGFALPRNFDLPYRSLSITEFWRRWHISLSSWFRDYVYIPLGGNRGTPAATYRNLVTIFLLCGLWHGAAWTLVLWGIWHGLFLVLERAGLDKILYRLPVVASWAYAMIVVMAGWVLFRATSLQEATGIWKVMAGWSGQGESQGLGISVQPVQSIALVLGSLLALGVLRARGVHQVRFPRTLSGWRVGPPAWPKLSSAMRLSGLTVLLVLCLLDISGGTYSPFLYFRF